VRVKLGKGHVGDPDFTRSPPVQDAPPMKLFVRSLGCANPSTRWLLVAAWAVLLPCAAQAATTTYTGIFSGGTIAPGDTVVLNDGATVTGNVTTNGTLQFNQTGALTISNTISGTGELSLTNIGALTLTATTGANTIVLDMTTSVASGTLLIRNSGTGTLRIGNTRSGTLNVTGGSILSAIGSLGVSGSGNGSAAVSSGTWSNTGTLYVGSAGTGTLNVNGGYVSSGSNMYVAYGLNSTGSATVSSGTVAVTQSLSVGYNGRGTLNVNGGLVTSGSCQLGNSGGNATVLVSSGTFTTGRFDIGSAASGRGTLNVSGGSVNSVTTYLSGTAITTGGGTASLSSGTWTNSGNLFVGTGTSGTGTLNISGSGVLVVGGVLSRGSKGTINLDAGGTLALSGTGSIGDGGLSLGTGGVFDLSALASSTATLPATGNLTGVGTLSGSGHTLAVLGSFLPGNSPGTVTLGSGFTLDLSNTGTSVFEITSPLFTAGTYDLVNGPGNVLFGGVLNLAFSGGTYAEGTNVLKLFANTGSLGGTFTSVQWSGLASGQSATFDATTGFITVVPEPTTCGLAAIGAALAGLSRFRKRRRIHGPHGSTLRKQGILVGRSSANPHAAHAAAPPRSGPTRAGRPAARAAVLGGARSG